MCLTWKLKGTLFIVSNNSNSIQIQITKFIRNDNNGNDDGLILTHNKNPMARQEKVLCVCVIRSLFSVVFSLPFRCMSFDVDECFDAIKLMAFYS